jgi:hypothetical protein
MSTDAPDQATPTDNPAEEGAEMMDIDEDEEKEQEEPQSHSEDTRPPRENRKDKDLNSFLNSMDKYAPIVLPAPFTLTRSPTQ